jgi:hypothetical protein
MVPVPTASGLGNPADVIDSSSKTVPRDQTIPQRRGHVHLKSTCFAVAGHLVNIFTAGNDGEGTQIASEEAAMVVG